MGIDLLVHKEPDKIFTIYVYKIKFKVYIAIHTNQTLSSEVWYLKANEPKEKFKLFQNKNK